LLCLLDCSFHRFLLIIENIVSKITGNHHWLLHSRVDELPMIAFTTSVNETSFLQIADK
jgi:hypothetical protein